MYRRTGLFFVQSVIIIYDNNGLPNE